ncbi:hypothetical protein tloyanaT_13070 [Thalassotalea loyana]|uniref:Multidrug transporter n=1 Tax=Thalassotalea loyana TaxID=280483 RepID=A0ABQ6HC90_9GAMM|nr:hypothetical protein [Thalassotalea loyana]GLX85055.1 hypothetical protein tloyanaT_13070 [Thalassotalea loyana]
MINQRQGGSYLKEKKNGEAKLVSQTKPKGTQPENKKKGEE